MKIVIACAGGKRAGAGLMRTTKGKPVKFIAQPKLAPKNAHHNYAMPDDISDDGTSWRTRLCAYNATHEKNGDNPCNLLFAGKLYKPRAPYCEIYSDLVNKYGVKNVYIMSAGWGLVSADFLLPNYDITYSSSAKEKHPHKYRGKNDWKDKDFCMLPKESTDLVVFFCGKDYLKPFCELTKGCAGERIGFYKSKTTQKMQSIKLINYPSNQNYTWTYEAAQKLIDGKLVL